MSIIQNYIFFKQKNQEKNEKYAKKEYFTHRNNKNQSRNSKGSWAFKSHPIPMEKNRTKLYKIIMQHYGINENAETQEK